MTFRCALGFCPGRTKASRFDAMPQGCRAMSKRVVHFNRSVYGVKQASTSWHSHLGIRLISTGFEASLADACVFRLMEAGSVSSIAVVHIDDSFAVGRNTRCDRFGKNFSHVVPINNLGEIRCSAGRHYSRDKVTGLLTISKRSFTEKTVNQFGVTAG